MSARSHNHRLVVAAMTSLVLIGTGVTYSEEVSWVVDRNGFWHEGGNWSTGLPPQTGDSVVINRPAADITVTYSSLAGSSLVGDINCTETLTVEGGSLTLLQGTIDTLNLNDGVIIFFLSSNIGALTLSGGALSGMTSFVRLDVTGLFTWTGGTITFLGGFNAAGATEISGAGSKQLTGTFYISGNARWDGTGTINLGPDSWWYITPSGRFDVLNSTLITNDSGNATVRNDGEFRKVSGHATTINALFLNYGTLRMQSGTLDCVAGYTQHDGQSRLEGGTMVSPWLIEFLGGSLTGNGDLTGDVSNEATVRPGAGVGTTTITGDYSQTVGGTIAVELGGTDPVEYDLLEVAGGATLAGDVNVTLVNGFVPLPGDTFEVMAYSSRSGSFDSLSAPNLPVGFDLLPTYTDDRVILVTTLASAVWVHFAAPPGGLGTFFDPFDTLAAGVSTVEPGGTVMIKAGSSNETPTIAKALTLDAFGGSVVIGQ